MMLSLVYLNFQALGCYRLSSSVTLFSPQRLLVDALCRKATKKS